MRQFGIFVVAIIPIIVGLTLVFGAASLGAAAQVGIDIAIIISGFAIYFFLIIMPLEKWQAKKRAQRIKAEEERVKADGE